MALRDEVVGSQRRVGAPSKLDEIKRSLSPEEGGELDELIADETVTATAIGVALRRRGFRVADNTVQGWRRRMVGP